MKKIVIVVFLSAFVAAPAVAASAYWGVNAGSNKIIDTTPGSSANSSSTGYGILGGYSFNEKVSAEASYYNLGDASVDGTSQKLSGRVIAVSAVGFLPLSKDFSLMAKMGYASSSISFFGFSGSTAGLNYGVGAQYSISKTADVRFNYDLFRVGGGDFITMDSKLMSVGMVFRMNSLKN